MSRSRYLSNVKIAKRHNAAVILMGILCLFSVAIPALLWLMPIFPWFKIAIEAVPEGSQFVTGSSVITILDLIKYLFNLGSGSFEIITVNAEAALSHSGNLLHKYLTIENIYAVSVWYLLSALLYFILFIQGLVLLIRGRLARKGAPVIVAFWAMVATGMVLLDTWRLGFFLNYSMVKASTVAGLSGAVTMKYTWLFPNLYTAAAAGGLFIVFFFIWLIGLRGRYYREDIEFVELEPENKPFERNNGISRNTLPPEITSVGGHAFAKNVNLEIATIASGVDELGIGAFSNCLRLKVVSLPSSVRVIDANCFFNCCKLKRINYAGTKQQWSKIKRGSNWLCKAGTTTVVCKDGPISVDPYK